MNLDISDIPPVPSSRQENLIGEYHGVHYGVEQPRLDQILSNHALRLLTPFSLVSATTYDPGTTLGSSDPPVPVRSPVRVLRPTVGATVRRSIVL
jgi:hypothetical protein